MIDETLIGRHDTGSENGWEVALPAPIGAVETVRAYEAVILTGGVLMFRTHHGSVVRAYGPAGWHAVARA